MNKLLFDAAKQSRMLNIHYLCAITLHFYDFQSTVQVLSCMW